MITTVLVVVLTGLVDTTEYFNAQFETLVRACQTDAGSDACADALNAASQVEQLRRVAAESQPKPVTRNCPQNQLLQACLEAHVGKGVLVLRLTSDFVYFSAAGDRVRALIGTTTPGGLMIFSDRIVASPLINDVLKRTSAPVINDGSNTTWRFEPYGSNRFFAAVRSDVYASDTPVVPGAHVLCADTKRIVPLGALRDVVLAGTGYHPEQTPQHPRYLYQSPCNGYVIGAGVAGIHDGAYRPAVQPTKKVGPGCSETECRFSLRGPKGRATEIVFSVGEGTVASVQWVGDINGDGVDDCTAEYGDAGTNSQELYTSSSMGWTSVARSEGFN